MQVAFIGLGNVGGKLAGNLARSGHALVVHDLNEAVGARWLRPVRVRLTARHRQRQSLRSSSPACHRPRHARQCWKGRVASSKHSGPVQSGSK